MYHKVCLVLPCVFRQIYKSRTFKHQFYIIRQVIRLYFLVYKVISKGVDFVKIIYSYQFFKSISKLVNLEISKQAYCSFIVAEKNYAQSTVAKQVMLTTCFISLQELRPLLRHRREPILDLLYPNARFFYPAPIRVQSATQRPLALPTQAV